MFVDNPLKRVQVDCLMAFCHSRISGIAGYEQDGVVIFNNKDVLDVATSTGKELENILKDLSTIETINSKISSPNNIGLANMYHYHYTKLLTLLDNSIAKDEKMIEGLIGLHLMVLSIELGIINDDNLEAFNYIIGLYENEKFINDDDTLKVVNNMRVVSRKIFTKYWEKPKRLKRK